MQVKKQQLEPVMEQWSGSKMGKEYLTAVYYHLAYLTYFIRNPEEDESQAGINTVGRNISNLRYADDATLMEENKELKSLLMKVKEENEKAGLKLNILKGKVMASGHITSWQIDEEKIWAVTGFIFSGSKITAETDYSHVCCLEEKLYKPRQRIKKQRDHFANRGPYSQSYVFFQ